ncbi:MAG: DUF3592 domain-containing protein [Acidobacteriota bacterium]|nr:DUF3592 domain-containing protein [Blastocatellia bacterium]MDW8412093.1 DUF3592 domain-containing protein [Acidobacteriota bacterium]
MHRKLLNVLYFLFSLAMLATGVVAVMASMTELNKNRLAATWPEVTADITKVWIKPITIRTGTQNNQYASTIYEVNLEYAYRVNGKSYSGQSIAPRQAADLSSIKQAEAVANYYETASRLQIYYNPLNVAESRSVHRPISSSFWIFILAIGLVNVISGTAILRQLLRRKS